MWDRTVQLGDATIPVRLFAPSGEGPFPLLLFFHGGGWVTGEIENYTGVCADLSKATGCTVASVDYRLAPEHKFPAAPEDCYAVARECFMGRMADVGPDDITLIGDAQSSKARTKTKALIELIRRNPYQTPPPYEKLQGDLQGAYFRRINIKHRFVYQVLEDKKAVKIISLWTHYQI